LDGEEKNSDDDDDIDNNLGVTIPEKNEENNGKATPGTAMSRCGALRRPSSEAALRLLGLRWRWELSLCARFAPRY
jgi:hypothetical protein